jgi:hypothetical protein
MDPRAPRFNVGRVAWMVGLALLMGACAEVTGPLADSASSIAKYLSPDPVVTSGPVAASSIPPGAVRYRRLLMQAWEFHFGLAEDPAIGFGQVHQESRFDCAAVNARGSAGCAQFMPATAEWINALIPKAVRDTCPSRSGCPMDPRWALTALVEYDWRLWSSHAWAADDQERWAFTLATYNGGGAVTGGERAACAKNPGCNPARYFKHVELFCGTTGRSTASCEENRAYARIILKQWAPIYHTWLRS